MEPKNLERLYQEKLKDLEMNPNPVVWNKIESSLLAQQNSTKGILWYWTSGTIAVVLLLGFFIIKQNALQPIYSHAYLTQIDSVLTPKTTVKDLNINISATSTPYKKKAKNHQLKKEKTQAVHSKNIIAEKTFAPLQNKKTSATLKKLSKEKTIVSTKKEPLLNFQKDKPFLAQKTLTDSKINTKIANNKSSKKEWSIAPIISQYYYGAFSNNSPVDNRLDNAKKTGQLSTSYGVNVAYQATNKIKIKTGIHRISLLQTTDGNLVSGIQRTSSFANASKQAPSKSALMLDNTSTNFDSKSELTFIDNSNSQLEQSIGYIEIPVEVNFSIYQSKKFKMFAVGGLSTLFLTENNLQIQSGQFSFSEGEANNLNNLNFSFNLGTDFEYHFSSKWFLNLAPSLKIQTQTFSTSNNNPYLIGVSTGVNYKF